MKMCSKCKEKIRWPGSTYCHEHLLEYHTNRRAKQKIERDTYLIDHNEYGERLDKFGWTPSDYQRENDRLDKTYGKASD